MGAVKAVVVMPILAVAFACSQAKPSRDAALNEQLRSDLNRAAAPISDLAATRFRPDHAVSGIELGAGAASVTFARRPTAPAAKRVTDPAVALAPSLTAAKLVALGPAPKSPVTAATAAPMPFAYVPMPVVSGPIQEGGGFGHAIGAVLRGGLLGDGDHCQTRPGMGGIFINVRAPMQPSLPGPRGIW